MPTTADATPQLMPLGMYTTEESLPIVEEPASSFSFLSGFAGGLTAGAALVYSIIKKTGQKVSDEAKMLELGAFTSVNVESPAVAHAAFVAPRAPQVCMGAKTKPQRVNIRNREYNKMYRSEMRTRMKRVREAVDEGDYSAAVPALSKCFAIIDKNVKRNIIHKNTAARKKSQLHMKVKALEPTSAPAPTPAPASTEGAAAAE